MPICAYCKQVQERQLTREHVIPAFLYALQKQTGEGFIGWNEVSRKMVGGEAKVKDVCADCNNRILSELDSYGKELLSQSGLLVHNYLRRTVTLRYEYGILLRWLMKISFNSSRTDGAHSHLFEEHIPFILGSADTPPRYRVRVAAYLASPIVPDKLQMEQEPFRTASHGAKTLNPFLVRICYGFVPGGDLYTLRILIFGPLVFHLLIFNEGTLPGNAAVAIRRFLKMMPGARELTPTLRLLDLQAGAQTWLDLYAYQVQRAHAIVGGA
jgi:hypothetical protein